MDKYKIVKRLEYCAENKCDICQEENGSGFPWIDGRCYGFTERLYDALALLKEQEPMAVHVTAEINYRKIGNCPNCGKPINSGDYPNYCGHCGQAVKWE